MHSNSVILRCAFLLCAILAAGVVAPAAAASGTSTASIADRPTLRVEIVSPAPLTGHVLVEREGRIEKTDAETDPWETVSKRPITDSVLTYPLPAGVYRVTVVAGEIRSAAQRIAVGAHDGAVLRYRFASIDIRARSTAGPAWAECWLERSSVRERRARQPEQWRLVANPGLRKGATSIAVPPGRYRLKLCTGLVWTSFRGIAVDEPERIPQRYYFASIQLPAVRQASDVQYHATVSRVLIDTDGQRRCEAIGSWPLGPAPVTRYLTPGRYRVDITRRPPSEAEPGPLCSEEFTLRWIEGVRVVFVDDRWALDVTRVPLKDVDTRDVALLSASPIAAAEQGVSLREPAELVSLVEQARRGRAAHAEVISDDEIATLAAAASPLPDRRWSAVLRRAVAFFLADPEDAAARRAALERAFDEWLAARDERRGRPRRPTTTTATQPTTRPGD